MEGQAELINRELNGPGLQETLGIVVEADSTRDGSKDVSYLNAENEGMQRKVVWLEM